MDFSFIEIAPTTTSGPLCVEQGTFPYPGCKGFYICIDKLFGGGFWEFSYSCPDGQLFNVNWGFCVFPVNAPEECKEPVTTTTLPTTTGTKYKK